MKNTILFDTFSDLRESMSYSRCNLIDHRLIIATADKNGVDMADVSELKNSFEKCNFMPQLNFRFMG